jgi:hypothetical protein
MRPTVTAHLNRPMLMLAMLVACCCSVRPQAVTAAEGIDPAAMPQVLSESGDELVPTSVIQEPASEERIILEPDGEFVSGPSQSILSGEMLDDGGEPVPVVESVVESMGEPPRILDVSSQSFDGMLMDDFNVDEMPYEASSGRWFWNGGWYIGGESLWMDRSREDRVSIAHETIPTIAGSRLVSYTTTPQPFNVSPGARVTIGKSLGRDYLDRDRAIEFIYYGGLSYNDNDGRNARSADGFFTPLDIFAPGFNGASTYLEKFNSDFNSWEWNYKLRRRLGRDQLVMSPGGNWTRHAERGWLPALIVGTRLATVNEDFQLKSSRTNVPASQFSGQYTVNTQSWLLGLNIGGELISQNEFYYWGIRGRAAPALSFNDMSQSAFGVNTTGTPQSSQGTINNLSSGTRTGAGFIGDLTLLAGWQITPNFALQAGYDFLWIAGMATATRQFNLDNRDTNAIDVGGQTFYNGVSFGFNGSW